MIIKDLTDLIDIRNYVTMMTNNSMIDKKLIRGLYDMQINLDKYIVEKVLSSEFKKHLGFGDEQMLEAVKEAAKTNNIRTGMKTNLDTVVVATPGNKEQATQIKTLK
jgi:hypothetical protein